jgi:HK97 family phage prohead protease
MRALASTFGNVDHQGDRVMPGAFTTAVARIKAGATLPLIWGHDAHGSPQNWVGKITDADQTTEGLEVHARFDLDDPVARKAWRLVRDGDIDKLSIGYQIPNGGQRRANGANELHTIDLKEVSLVMQPANDRARVLSVKSDDDGLDRVRAQFRDHMLHMLGAAPTESLRQKSERIAAEHGRITVAEFPC